MDAAARGPVGGIHEGRLAAPARHRPGRGFEGVAQCPNPGGGPAGGRQGPALRPRDPPPPPGVQGSGPHLSGSGRRGPRGG
eukprot:5547197-Pyramimonas_sp.AAC.1